MKRRNRTNLSSLIAGELYLFHPTDPSCPPESSLWGIYDRTENGIIYLESSSRDLRAFRFWHALPPDYRHIRLSTRSELRDYAANLFLAENASHRARRLIANF